MQSCCVRCNFLFCLWVNVFCLPLLVGHSCGVRSKRKKGTKKNETVQSAGTVHEMQQEFSGLWNLIYFWGHWLYIKRFSLFSNIQTLSVDVNKFLAVLCSMLSPSLLYGLTYFLWHCWAMWKIWDVLQICQRWKEG